jgi:DNA-binding transcriptional regulator YiaG
MQYRMIIEEARWVDGSGWSYTSTFDNQVIDEIPDKSDWSWIREIEIPEGEDIQWTASYYAIDADGTEADEPTRKDTIWHRDYLSCNRVLSLRTASGMSRKDFAAYFGLPYRTLQAWEIGDREAPEYLVDLIEYKLRNEGKI